MLLRMRCSFQLAVAVLFGTLIVSPMQASIVLVASSAGESAHAGAPLVRRVNDESDFIRAVEITPNPEWTDLGSRAPWVSRTTDYLKIPDDVVLEFSQEIQIPVNFELQFGLLIILSAFTSYSTLNGFELTSPIFFPGRSCAEPSPGSPGCVEPFAVEVTPFLLPGENIFMSQALGVEGSGIAHAWEFNLYGTFKPTPEVPEPNYILLLGGLLFGMMRFRYRRAP